MTGIHHTAPTTYLRATRQQAHPSTGLARRPARLLLGSRQRGDRSRAARLPRWVDVTPAKAAR